MTREELRAEIDRRQSARAFLRRRIRVLRMLYSLLGVVGFFAWLGLVVLGGCCVLSAIFSPRSLQVVLPLVAIGPAPDALAAARDRVLAPDLADGRQLGQEEALDGYAVSPARRLSGLQEPAEEHRPAAQ